MNSDCQNYSSLNTLEVKGHSSGWSVCLYNPYAGCLECVEILSLPWSGRNSPSMRNLPIVLPLNILLASQPISNAATSKGNDDTTIQMHPPRDVWMTSFHDIMYHVTLWACHTLPSTLRAIKQFGCESA